MNVLYLVLYTRQGCCLCEGLQDRLSNIPLDQLKPSLELLILDIDGSDVSDEIRLRFQNEVPVLLLRSKNNEYSRELPRVSPRLQEQSLFNWLQQTIFKTINLS